MFLIKNVLLNSSCHLFQMLYGCSCLELLHETRGETMTNRCNVKHHYVKSNDKSNMKLQKYENQSYLAEASGITGLF